MQYSYRTTQSDIKTIQDSTKRLLKYSEKNKFIGYGKFDALSSPFLKAMSFNNPKFRLCIIQGVMRFPFHVRPLFGVRKSGNPKGFGLFAMSYMDRFLSSGKEDDLNLARHCLDWLLENSSPGYSGRCWGYNFDWQNGSLFYAPSGFPNCVVSVVCGEAMLKGYEITKDEKYLQAAKETADFILRDLPVLLDEEDRKSIAYVPIKGVGIVINVNALAGAFLAKLSRTTGNESMRNESLKMLRYVVSTQTEYGAWFYTDPAKKSYIRHDHYHTGFILDGILETCQAADTDEFMPAYDKGLDYYLENLFLENGAPKYMNDRVFPHDIHGSAQALITLVNAADKKPECLDRAVKTALWTIENMQRKDGAFCYQIGPVFKRRFSLMRWCNAWMARGLTGLLLKLSRTHI